MASPLRKMRKPDSSAVVSLQVTVKFSAPPLQKKFHSWITAARGGAPVAVGGARSEEHTSELQSPGDLVCRLLLEKKNNATMAYCELNLLTANTPFITISTSF